ncbi:MAG: Beta-lactamase class C-like and penicillin binding proteins (PBPs) superfamily, partial [uncultured Phycisphaerae bacterium]
AVAVVAGGEVRFYGYGRRSADDPRPPDEHTVYEIGSVTKGFTGLLLAAAAEAGEVKLDDPAQQHLPAAVRLPVKGGKPITLAHLATHRSGLSRMPTNFRPTDPANPYADYSVEQMYAFVNGVKPAREPGEGFEYSNLGMGLLGHLLALKAGTSYEQLVVERVCKPLGMADTRVVLTDDARRRLAPPHDADAEPASNWDIPTLAGAGALRSTAKDMAAFVAAQLRPDEKTPLGRAIRRSHQPRAAAGGANDIALGWHVQRRDGVVWHNGQTGGYHAYVGFRPDTGAGVVLLTNTGSGTIDAAGAALLRLLAGGRAEPPSLPKLVAVPAATLDRYVGRYLMPPGVVMEVTRVDDRLYARLGAQPRLRIYPAAADRFHYRAVAAEITFFADGEGGGGGREKAASRLVLRQDGRELPGGRMGPQGEAP